MSTERKQKIKNKYVLKDRHAALASSILGMKGQNLLRVISSMRLRRTQSICPGLIRPSLNEALAGSQYSVWGLVGGAAQQAGAKEFPDLNEVFQHTASVLGSEQFGVPRVPDNHKPADIPLNFLKALWPALLPTVKLFCPNPVDWPILYSLAIQEAIHAGKDSLDPSMAFRIVMESAIPMSKVDLANS